MPASATEPAISLSRVAGFSPLRALAWQGNSLYASRGYELLRAEITGEKIDWRFVARFHPPAWRKLTASFRLASRMFRDGFHALAVLPSGHIVAAVAGAIVTLTPGSSEFRTTHRITRGTRPLHFTVSPDGAVFWGEYFDNAQRDSVHLYRSGDQGNTWSVAYTFPKGSIRHIHNVVYDRWADCLWVLTGDNGSECRVLRATCDFIKVETILHGNQQARAVAAVPTEAGLYFSSDTPLERNYIYCLDRSDRWRQAAEISSSSIYGCEAAGAIFFSTMVEPSAVNHDRHVRLYASANGTRWASPIAWTKDIWPMRFFQYGNAFLPDGPNSSGILAVSTIAVASGDHETSLWRVSPHRSPAG